MHFPVIWRSKFTDLSNSKKTQSLGKNGLDKSAWIKACSCVKHAKLQLYRAYSDSYFEKTDNLQQIHK